METRANYLLEVGAEELPAGFLETAPGELAAKAQEALEKNRLGFDRVEVLYTPRRLALMIYGLTPHQAAAEELHKGPPVSVGLDADGKPTKAAEGFARKLGVEVADLKRETFDGVDYLVLRRAAVGQPAEAVLPEILPEVVLSLSGSHFMTWDESDVKFSRPIRWLLSLLDDKPITVTIGQTASETATRGHRFLSEQDTVPILSVTDYVQQLQALGHVTVDPEQRKTAIREGLTREAEKLGGRVAPNEGLLETVTRLVEAPALVTGNFDPAFLSLPKEVITTVMESHQKYFAVEGPDGRLLPHFITISNNPLPDAADVIRLGNEKVLRARLEDAAFFFREDTRRPLADYVAALEGITFQKGLGTLSDKTRRLETLIKALGELAGQPHAVTNQAARAATLCKADLATNMVRELTELQGIVGQHYAALSNEPESVALAIAEHYQPRFMGDAVAQSTEGILLSLADKLDTLLAVFSQKDARYPTGSKDPMGLRRMSLGILQTLFENRFALDLDQAFALAYQNLGALAVEPEAEACERVRQFILQRLKGYLLDQNYPYDSIDAVLEAGISPFADLNRMMDRLQTLTALRHEGERFIKHFHEPANRTARILGQAYQEQAVLAQVQPGHFEAPSEQSLFDALSQTEVSASTSRDDLLRHFEALSTHVESFFNEVLVNAETPDVKENRYCLLSVLNGRYRLLADFTKLVV